MYGSFIDPTASRVPRIPPPFQKVENLAGDEA